MLRILCLAAAMAVASAAGGTAAAAAPDVDLILRIPPEFPADAPPDVDEGWVIVEFTVNKEGSVENARAAESSGSVFEEPAVEAVKRYKYRPPTRNGVPVRVDGVRTIVRFNRPGTEEPTLTTLPAKMWESRTSLALASGHAVEVMPLQAVNERHHVMVYPGGWEEEAFVSFDFVAYVAFDESSVHRSELRSMAREIMDRYLSAEIERLEAREKKVSNLGTIRFVVLNFQRPGAKTVLVMDHADIEFERDDDGTWNELD